MAHFPAIYQGRYYTFRPNSGHKLWLPMHRPRITPEQPAHYHSTSLVAMAAVNGAGGGVRGWGGVLIYVTRYT